VAALRRLRERCSLHRREPQGPDAQREGFGKYNDRIVKERARVATYNAKVAQDNEGIRARNARTGEDIPLRVALAPPAEEPIDLDLDHAIQSIAAFDEADVPYIEMTKELGPIAAKAGAGGGYWEGIYDVVYRSLSAFGGHPTLMVLNSYLDAPGLLAHVSPRTTLPTLDVACMGRGIFLTSLLAEHVFEAAGCDVELFEEITIRYRDSPMGGGDV
jgi:hypothetical protein